MDVDQAVEYLLHLILAPTVVHTHLFILAKTKRWPHRFGTAVHINDKTSVILSKFLTKQS